MAEALVKIYVSYALVDREWVSRFAARLRGGGVEVSSWGSGFQLGGVRDDLLERRLAAVDFLVLVLTEDFVSCPHILRELGAAKLIGKPITSVLKEPEDGVQEDSDGLTAADRRVREFAADHWVGG